MWSFGNIVGALSLLFALLMFFGVTPKRIAKWAKGRSFIKAIVYSLHILVIIASLFFAINHIIVDPYNLGGNRWFIACYWLLYTIFFFGMFAERYLKWKYTIKTYQLVILFIVANILLVIGLSTPLWVVIGGIAVVGLIVLLIGFVIWLVMRKRKAQ